VQPGDTATVFVQQLQPLNTPTVLTDQVTITTTGITGDTAHSVQVRVVPKGDVVTVSTPGGLDFGQVPILTPPQTGTLPIVFENRANASSAPAQITLNLGNNPSVFSVDRTTFTIAPNTTETVNVTFAPGTDKSILGNATSLAFNTTVGWSVGNDANCGGSSGASGSLALQGTATAAVVAINPSSLVFGSNGLVNCGAQGTPLSITLSNPGANQYTVRNVTLNHLYYQPPVLSGAVVAPGGTQTITVTPKPLPTSWGVVPDGTAASPGGFFNGTLTFETDAPNDTPHSIPLYMGVKGVVIAGAPPSQTQYNFRDATVGNQSFFAFSVVNVGNAPAEATFRAQNLSTVFGITPSPTVIAPGQLGTGFAGNIGPVSTTLTLFYQPTLAASTSNDRAYVQIAPTAGNVFCQPLPAAWDQLNTTGVTVQGSSP